MLEKQNIEWFCEQDVVWKGHSFGVWRNNLLRKELPCLFNRMASSVTRIPEEFMLTSLLDLLNPVCSTTFIYCVQIKGARCKSSKWWKSYWSVEIKAWCQLHVWPTEKRWRDRQEREWKATATREQHKPLIWQSSIEGVDGGGVSANIRLNTVDRIAHRWVKKERAGTERRALTLSRLLLEHECT